ncbi:MAG: DUF192 domain-containing protein [Candidatus Levyibacteriota bacterium]
MTIVNQTKQIIIANQTVVPTALLDQSLGLLTYKTAVAMLLKTRFGVHTFGMKYAIDVMILDETNHLAALKENLKPNQIFLWNPKHKTVIELPAGTIKKTKTKPGDKIAIE